MESSDTLLCRLHLTFEGDTVVGQNCHAQTSACLHDRFGEMESSDTPFCSHFEEGAVVGQNMFKPS